MIPLIFSHIQKHKERGGGERENVTCCNRSIGTFPRKPKGKRLICFGICFAFQPQQEINSCSPHCVKQKFIGVCISNN